MRRLLLSVGVICVLIGLVSMSVGRPSAFGQEVHKGYLPALFSPPPCTKVVNPGESIQAAITSAGNGSKICVRGGTYMETLRVRPDDSNLTITAYPGERPIIDGNKRLPGTVLDNLVQIAGTNITFQNFEVRHSTGRGIAVIQPGSNVTIRDVDVHDNWQSGILVKGLDNGDATGITYVSDVIIEDSRIYHNVRKAQYSPVVYRASRTGNGSADWQFNPDVNWDTPFWEGADSDIPEVGLDGLSLVLDSAGKAKRVYISNESTDTSYIHPDYSADGQEIAYVGHDILYHEPQANKWTVFFDGSQVGLPANSNVDAIWVSDQTVPGGCAECHPVLMSFGDSVTLPGLGLVGSGDIVQFTPTQIGRQTQGTFSFYRTAAQLALGSANIDAIDLVPVAGQTEMKLIISTSGNFSIPGGPTAQHQDLIAYNAGTWELYFDHSAIALNPLPEGMTATWIDNTGNVYISGDPAGGAAVVFHQARDSVVRGNEIYENWGEGLASGRLSDHITIEHNVSWDNLHSNLYLSVTNYPRVDSNLIYCTDNRALWRKTDTRFYRPGPGITIRDEVTSAGQLVSKGQVIINNIVVGCGRNFYVTTQIANSTLMDTVIANNTFFEAQGEAGSGSVNVRFAGIAFSNSLFSNNLIYQSTGEMLKVAGTTDISGLTVSNNLYYPAAPSGWKPEELGRVVGDPFLANPSNDAPPNPAWYMLRAGSPAIDAAAVLAQVTEDFFNNPKVGITPDIGAHEFGGAGGRVYQLTGSWTK